LCFGAIRPYKGVELLLEEFATMPGEDLILLIVGAVHLQDLRERILALGEGDNRIRIVPEFIAPNDVQCYFNAADAVVLPFVEILSSSSAIVALSFGRPVIAPAVGCLPDLVTEDIGVLYDRREPHALRTALERCLTLDLETMGRSGYARVQQYTWERVAARTLQAYQE
jgi:beta-1,4-mannosyltransferase